jgi:hypothetical protein
MSDQTDVITNDVQAPSDDTNTGASESGARKRTRKASAPKDSFSVTDLARARLRKRGVKSDDRLSDECKVVRGILRSNFDFVRKNDATVRKAKDAHNDRKPWPTNMGKHTFAVAVEGKRPPQAK